RGGDRELGRVVAEGGAGPLQASATGGDIGRAGASAAAALLSDQVDDAARTLRVERRRGVGDHLDPLDLIGGQLLQGVGAALALELRRGLAVHQDGDVAVAAEREVALQVDVHRRQVAQRVGDRAGRGLQVLAQRVALAVDRGLDVRAPAGDGQALDGLGARLGRLGGGLGGRRLWRIGLGHRRCGGGGAERQGGQPQSRTPHRRPLPHAPSRYSPGVQIKARPWLYYDCNLKYRSSCQGVRPEGATSGRCLGQRYVYRCALGLRPPLGGDHANGQQNRVQRGRQG